MQEKVYVIIIYGLLGLGIAFYPLLLSFSKNKDTKGSALPPRNQSRQEFLSILCIAGSVCLLHYTKILSFVPFLILLVACFLLAAILTEVNFLQHPSRRAVLLSVTATFLAFTAGATLLWWRRGDGTGLILSPVEGIYIAVCVIGLSVLLLLKNGMQKKPTARFFIFGAYCLAAAYFSFSQATNDDPATIFAFWHHWGAYLGPSELVRAGARIFHDIPAQYGAGPTMLLAMAGERNEWSLAYWIFGLTAFFYTALIGAMALALQSRKRCQDIVVLLICLAACTFWISYPPEVISPLATPSTSGMRFLPVTMLAAWLIFSVNKKAALRVWISHLLWIVGALWSPESAFFVTAVWWPIYIFDTRCEGNFKSQIGMMLRATCRLFGIAFGTVLIAVLIYRMTLGVYPKLSYIFAYTIYPPGPLPINPQGSIWFFGLVILMSVWISLSSWKQTGNRMALCRSMVLQLLAFSTFSYYLGRSHDNNLLNLMPFLVLVMMDSLANASGLFARHYLAVSLAITLALTTTFGWQVWSKAAQDGKLTDFDFAKNQKKLSYDDPSVAMNLALRYSPPSPEHLKQANQLMDVARRRGEPFLILDNFYLLQPHYPGNAWCALHAPANFAYSPSFLRQEFLRNTAERIKRSGWVIVDRTFEGESWLADFDAVYQRTERIDMETYYAIRYALAKEWKK